MPKRSTIIDSAIDEVVDKKLEERMGGLLTAEEIAADEEEQKEAEIIDQERQLELEKAKVTFLNSHHYVKLYRIDTLNPKHPLFLEIIYDLDCISDIETYIQQLAFEKGWSSGKYRAAFFLKEPKTRMEAKIKYQAEYNINVPKNNLMDNANQIADNKSKETDALAAVEKSAQLIKTVRDAIGNSSMQGNSLNDSKMIAETFKMGIDTVKDAFPNRPQTDLSETIIKLLPVIKEIFQKPKEPSLLEQITALKAAGIIPEQKESSLTNKIVEAALAKLLEGGGGESPSIGVEIVKQIAPQVPNMVERITGTINNALAYASNKPISQTVVKQEMPAALPMPLFNELLVASENKDYNYFQKLAHGIGFLLDNGDMYLQAILNGDVTVDMAIDMLTQIGGESFRTDNMKSYITKFFEWYKSQFQKQEIKKEEEETEDKVFGECDKCHIEYGFEDDEHFNEFVKLKDSTCDEIIDGAICGGKVKKIENTK